MFFRILYNVFQIITIAIPLCTLIYIILRRRREKTGPNLIVLGKHENKTLMYFGLFLLLSLSSQLTDLINGRDFSFQAIFGVVIGGLFTLGVFSSATTEIYILKNGISQFHWKQTKWEQVGSYLWDNRNENRLFFFKKGGGKIELIIAPEERPQLHLFLQKQLGNPL